MVLQSVVNVSEAIRGVLRALVASGRSASGPSLMRHCIAAAVMKARGVMTKPARFATCPLFDRNSRRGEQSNKVPRARRAPHELSLQ